MCLGPKSFPVPRGWLKTLGQVPRVGGCFHFLIPLFDIDISRCYSHSLIATKKKSLFVKLALTTKVSSSLVSSVSAAIFHYSLANVNQGPIGYESVKRKQICEQKY